jgi:hypothetical protein
LSRNRGQQPEEEPAQEASTEAGKEPAAEEVKSQVAEQKEQPPAEVNPAQAEDPEIAPEKPIRRRPIGALRNVLNQQFATQHTRPRPNRLFPPRRGQQVEPEVVETPPSEAPATQEVKAKPEDPTPVSEEAPVNETSPPPADQPAEEVGPISPFNRPGRLRRPLINKNPNFNQPRTPKKTVQEKKAEETKEAEEPSGHVDIISRLRSRPRLNIINRAQTNNQPRQSPQERRNSIFRRGPGARGLPQTSNQLSDHSAEAPLNDGPQPQEELGATPEAKNTGVSSKTSTIVSSVAVTQSEDANPAPLEPEAASDSLLSNQAPAEKRQDIVHEEVLVEQPPTPVKSSRVSLLSRLQNRKPGSLFSRHSDGTQQQA